MMRRLGVVTMVLALAATACVTDTGGGAPQLSNFRLRATRVEVVQHNDNAFYGSTDEPFIYNLWFRVRLGDPNSATVGLTGSRDNAVGGLGNGDSRPLVGAQQAAVDFNGIKLLDIPDLFDTSNHLEIVGSWTWAMEQDDVSVAGVANSTLAVVRNALNATVAAGSVPSDTGQLVSTILGDFGQAFNLIAGALFASTPGIPDDAIGSKFFIGLGVKGQLAQIVDSAVIGAAVPSVAIPVVSVPPDIGGGAIFTLGQNVSFSNSVFDQGNGRHAYDISFANSGSPSDPANVPPIASFTPSVVNGTPPLAVSFDSSTSHDPDGSIVTYAWNFGDFTSSTGPNAQHTYNSGGLFPVTLTVTDNRGDAVSSTINISIGGGPTTAPTGLTKTGSGCCDTYGDFSWDPVPGATAYEIDMAAYFGGGCLTSASDVFEGQRSAGTVQQLGLCLGSHYNTRIRARANGIWGPWSPTQNLVL